ncbi:hypothetical protein BUALT_Bualt18G0068200 [Buddleja alternifolia]|uniref:tetraacyldisaccharide 4'-kinase n=1 Tax=Buddleja alternifolia TaxID=168488 RepID=A0AAV6W9F6_9LAMI|nr:hypothetical protein BUALT_Bualt18G0068200 [Buddleja alternifolia]
MEKLRRAVKQIAYTKPHSESLSAVQLSLIPLLSFASSLYSVALRLRRQLYRFNILTKHRLPVPVISVGNLTWGGNGKTPMVEFLARSLADDGISPLILTRGYGGADEAKMLERQLQGTSARIGVGANRAAIAASFLERYGYITFHGSSEKLSSDEKAQNASISDRIGAAILDDGMQHLSVWRDLEIVMVNALMPWGNHQLLPLGPLREPLSELGRADIIIIHHADLVLFALFLFPLLVLKNVYSNNFIGVKRLKADAPNVLQVQEKDAGALESTIRKVKRSAPIFFTKMAPIHFFSCRDISCKVVLEAVQNMVVLCLSGIGFADSFIQRIQRMGPAYVDHVDFSDHHFFQLKDIEMVQTRLRALESEFDSKPIVVVTEKDYDRAPEMLDRLKPYEVLVLHCRLQFLSTENSFKKIMKQHLSQR